MATAASPTAAMPIPASPMQAPPSPPRRSRFQFHSDTKAPVELKELEQQSHKRATDFRRRVNQLDHNVAAWTSRFTQEVVERDKESVEMYDAFVTDPLERSVEKFMRLMDEKFGGIQGSSSWSSSRNRGQQDDARNISLDTHTANDDDGDADGESVDPDDGNHHHHHQNNNDNRPTQEVSGSITTATVTNACTDDQNDNDDDETAPPPSLQSLSNQISKLSKDMLHYTHVTIPSLRDQHLDSFHRKLRAEIPPKLHMEKTKAAKREQAIFQRFESMAGLASRSLAEENSQRIASLKLLEEKILEAGGWDEKRTCRFLEEVKEIRGLLEKEREERVNSDERVLENIVQCRVQLQQALLEAMADE